ncbi:MAG: hypothetical protein OQK69_02850, partial [Gammaproteobacteria bacterium]|nr:hypothetical protein [Gammaproteobacteria bacterium]
PFFHGSNHNYVAEIRKQEKNHIFYIEYHVVSNRVRGLILGTTLDQYHDIVKIGNIHENKELLKIKRYKKSTIGGK